MPSSLCCSRCLRVCHSKFRQNLQSPNLRIRAVYFPESRIVSVVAVSNGGRRHAEVVVVGREGMTGKPQVLGADRSPSDVYIQVAAKASASG